MTFYLKYRPQKIDELDLESVRQQLAQALKSKSLPHAFLFAGPRGLGKTSSARILAKAINCQQSTDYGLQQRKKQKSVDGRRKANIEPCNKCEACLSITRGSALDVMEIDGASNRGIDDIRELREKIKLSPISLRKKVYVIDEVHMLTKEAFNALLKTLEEPPDHAVFILATTEPDKLPPTIISRCFVLHFHEPSDEEIKRSLKRVIKGEKLKVGDKVLDLIAEQADGSFRDAHKILEQLAFTGKRIDQRLFESVFVSLGEEKLLKLLEKKDVARSLEWVKKAQERGVDWKLTIQKLLEKIREELLAIYGVGPTQELEFSESQLKELVRLLTLAGGDLRKAPIPHLPLEMVIIEFCSVPNQSGNSNDNFSKQVIEPKKNSTKETKPLLKDSKPSSVDSGKPAAFALNEVVKRWEEILKVVKPQNHSVEALLRSARPLRVEGDHLVVEVFYEFHKGRLETAKCRTIVENSLQQVLGNKQLKVSYILGEKKPKKGTSQTKSEPVGNDEELVKNAEAIFSQ